MATTRCGGWGITPSSTPNRAGVPVDIEAGPDGPPGSTGVPHGALASTSGRATTSSWGVFCFAAWTRSVLGRPSRGPIRPPGSSECWGLSHAGEAGRHPSRDLLLSALSAVLHERGFEPKPSERGGLYLRNCPFDALSADYREVVCPMNLSMMQGVLEGLGASDLEAVLEPKPTMCCVAFRPTTGVRTAG